MKFIFRHSWLMSITIFLASSAYVYGTDHPQRITSATALKTFIEDSIAKGVLPKALPVENHFGSAKFEPVDFTGRAPIRWNPQSRCPDHKDEIIEASDPSAHSITCNAGDTLLYAGSENDLIDDATGNDIIYAGKGNDEIHAGSGSDILVYEKGWGHDRVQISGFEVHPFETIGNDGTYRWHYSSFVVFAGGITQDDLAWKENTLILKETGDSIEFDSRPNVNFVFYDVPSLPNKIQQNPQAQIAATVSYEGLDAESIEMAGTTAFVSSGNRGVDILNITNPDSPIRISTLSLPGRVMQTHLYGKLLCALQSDPYLEAKKGWISIINVSDPVHPKVLSTLTLDGRPYETAYNGNLLAVATVRGNSQGKEILLYDMTDPSHLKSMPPIRLKVPTRSLAFIKSVLYVGSSDLFELYAYDTAKKGNKEVFHRNEHKKWVQDIQTDERTMAIMSDQTIYLYPLSSTPGNAPVSTIRIENDFALFKAFALYKGYLFAAERERGVRIYDISVLEKPKLVRRVPFDGALIRNVSVSEGSLFGVDINGNVHRKDITDLFRKSVTILIKGPAEEPRPKKETSRRQKLGQEQIQTYLYIAARDNDISMADEMLQQMGSINGRGHELFSPIEIASKIGNNEVLELMLQKGDKPDWKSQKAAMLAALGGHGDTLRLLERYGAPMNFKDPWDQCTPLHYAAQNCDVETVKFMISKKADPNAICRKNEKPINWARYGGNLSVIDYLAQVMKH